MKAVLLALNASFVHTSLSARYLAAACTRAGLKITVIESNINERAETVATRVAGEKPEVLLCSVYIWNRRLMEDVCTRIRLMYPHTLIVWGGPEVSYGEEGATPAVVDYILSGEGEAALPLFLQSLPTTARADFDQVRRFESLDDLPYPYEGEAFAHNKLYYFETSRGCPYACAYCLSSAEAGVRYMSLPIAKERLARMAAEAPIIKFVDRTFNANPARARELWRFLLAQPGECRFHFEVCAHLLSEEDFDILREPQAARFQFEIGLQSTSTQALSAINRAMDTEKILSNVRRLVQLGTVEVHLDLIAGLPGENRARFLQSFNDAMSSAPHRLHLGFLKLLPGTALRQRAEEEGYAFLPYAPYEVLRSPIMTADDFLYLKTLDRAVDRFYNSRQAEQAMRYAQESLAPTQAFDILSREEGKCVQEVVYLALKTRVPDSSLLKELCLFDYLMNEPHRKAPEALLSGPDNEQEAIRQLVYGDPERLYGILPHRKGERPGVILRQLRWARFLPCTLRFLGLRSDSGVFFDHGAPRGAKAFGCMT